MARLESVRVLFELVDGAYKGRYDIDIAKDFTATEHGEARRALGSSLLGRFIQAGRDGEPPDPEFFAAVVWLMKRRSAKGLAYQAVSDEITMASVDLLDPDEGEGDEDEGEVSPEA